MLRIGLDYHETITSHPSHFSKLAKTIIAGGGEVYIITAVEKQNAKKVVEEINKTGIKYTDIDVVVFENYDQVPDLKLNKCKERQVDFMIDDRLDTCQKVTNRGITGLGVAQRGNNAYKLPSKPNSTVGTNRPVSVRHRGLGSTVGGGIGETWE